MKSKFQKLVQKTKEVAATYTGTFIIIMLLNQVLFFGFCLNPICIIAAMPHVLFITVVVGTWLEKDKIFNDEDELEKTHAFEFKETYTENKEPTKDNRALLRKALRDAQQSTLETRELEKRVFASIVDNVKNVEGLEGANDVGGSPTSEGKPIHFDSFKEAHAHASKNSGFIVTRNPDGEGFIAYRK